VEGGNSQLGTSAGVSTTLKSTTYEYLTRDPVCAIAEKEQRHCSDFIYHSHATTIVSFASTFQLSHNEVKKGPTSITPSSEGHRIIVPISFRAKLGHSLCS
jgi:hypothetical protein